MEEYPDSKEMPTEAFNKLYYHGPSQTFQRHIFRTERDRHVVSLRKVQNILVTHYPDSAPLRVLLKKLDGAADSLGSWI